MRVLGMWVVCGGVWGNVGGVGVCGCVCVCVCDMSVCTAIGGAFALLILPRTFI